MSNESKSMSFFDRYLTLWVALCIIAGIAVGKFLPVVPDVLGKLEYANVSIPIAVLIWIMIFPMMLKIDFKSIVDAVKMPKGLTVTLVVNWLIKPFTMFGIAWLFFFVIYKMFIPEDLAREYLAGAVLLGAAPCTAMLFVWSHLTKGNPAYTLVQVAINDLIIIFSFQGDVILQNPLHILLIAVPLIIQTFFIFYVAYGWAKRWKLPHNIAAPAALIGASNFFELSVAVAIVLFGLNSGATLVTVVGVLVEVPVMLALVKIANKTA